jgi:hypothetical protein
LLGALALASTGLEPSVARDPSPQASTVVARVIATGVQGAGAISAVGVFHPGGPIHDNPNFAAMTQRGRVLDPTRILVTSTSNFGSPPLPGMPPGSVLSIDPSGPGAVDVPPAFATAGSQAAAVDGRVQLFSAASPGFKNGVNTPNAVTADLPAVSNARAISINNAFGRLWFSNAPRGSDGAGFESIVDPTGIPLAKAPDAVAGGVFTETKTNRSAQRIGGAIAMAAIGNALMGMSPDGSKRAVFAVLVADGSIVQVHTEQGLDGLAPAGTVSPAHRSPLRRAGMLFNWVPNRMLFVTDAVANAIVVLPIGDDGAVFTVGPARRIANAALHQPIDLAPAVPEIANGTFSSNTTLAGGSDIYVLNEDSTIVRMRQDGTPLAARRVSLPGGGTLGAGRLAGIATSPDATRIWLTAPADLRGAVLEIPAFGAATSAYTKIGAALAAQGAAAFVRTFDPQSGLGPLFNERSCMGCHRIPSAGGMGNGGLSTVLRVAHLDSRFDPLLMKGGPVARAHSVNELGARCMLQPGIPAGANAVSVRNTPALYASGAIDEIDEAAILSGARAYPDGVRGRPNWIIAADGTRRVGRFGWKADVPNLESFVGIAFRNELGITNPIEPHDLVDALPEAAACAGHSTALKDDGHLVRAVTAYLTRLEPPPVECAGCDRGEQTFHAIGCAECHAAALRSPSGRPLYSDLLLHDMGAALNDGFVQGSATGAEWRTTPLVDLRDRGRYLHDGRASTLADAISAHDGEAAPAVQRFRSLDQPARDALMAFLRGL